ncbi:hypothetical protein WD019_10130 [Fictibacillus sp. Mic-4]|uniref:hypothetical protein n=1 Tax=Fictibacillus TaxID=1329200 RepID=UPI000416CFAB|nr:hypothetical protein [Fictibacillus gelatini]
MEQMVSLIFILLVTMNVVVNRLLLFLIDKVGQAVQLNNVKLACLFAKKASVRKEAGGNETFINANYQQMKAVEWLDTS